MSEQEVFDALKYRIEVDGLGNRLYYNKAGQLHRTGGPAIECPDNCRYWYQYGHLHRTDGAAVEYDGTKEWWQNGKRHRTDGPAVERNDGYREWWINGIELPVYQDDLNITPQFILSKHIYDTLVQCCYNSVNAKLQ